MAVVNQSLAFRYWGTDQVVGRLVSGDGEQWVPIVGVVGDVRQNGLTSIVPDQLYVPLRTTGPEGATLLVRTECDPVSARDAIVDAVHDVDPSQPVAFVETLDGIRSISSPGITFSGISFSG